MKLLLLISLILSITAITYGQVIFCTYTDTSCSRGSKCGYLNLGQCYLSSTFQYSSLLNTSFILSPYNKVNFNNTFQLQTWSSSNSCNTTLEHYGTLAIEDETCYTLKNGLNFRLGSSIIIIPSIILILLSILSSF
eukprot:TRINITY_DN9697_c0_g1_i1.p1 TRINITY_DN9697_c0_g1~~TRINITY_DN9697_c0_g1_i1.p1  ORF type:complete len:136 (+),score=10.99 TRINITY_DN9697_c0_g1_i1:44-451(+)